MSLPAAAPRSVFVCGLSVQGLSGAFLVAFRCGILPAFIARSFKAGKDEAKSG